MDLNKGSPHNSSLKMGIKLVSRFIQIRIYRIINERRLLVPFKLFVLLLYGKAKLKMEMASGYLLNFIQEISSKLRISKLLVTRTIN